MNTTVEKNNPKIFPQNEGKINSKGMVAPPVPPKSSQAKFAGIKAIFERNVPHSQANDSNKTVSSNLGRTFGPTMQKLMEDNIHSTPNKQRRNSGDSAGQIKPVKPKRNFLAECMANFIYNFVEKSFLQL
ncbi:hypothetical protein RYF71_05280 [Wolbachia endosymbiont of Drosophila malagassya]|uniref:hypothetical protein n=1 Tax=Wolbachia endosymbiont of Drosophila seguyi TaxID=3002581 RepID=UPI0023A9EC4E|nr:hypothetical protein [Wolbachia endosymbiont of Drosophila seguyi]MDE5065733.1 hypothetical protein [Wolbachia endosymbiont of Drosophila seguyi]MDU8922663.1 hypothetical protein [Wolbachia endosymbiont of Drosophila seguyi]MDU8941411.1 hypothetical protein [Wolbachia endosymbiont of Drosophila malagassya]